jgi:hypothetical protein
MSLRNTNTISSHWGWQRRDHPFGQWSEYQSSNVTGNIVSMTPDATRCVVSQKGFSKATVMIRTGSSWVTESELNLPVIADSYTGYVCISADGNTCCVQQQVFYPSSSSIRDCFVYVFLRNGSTWTFEYKLESTNTFETFTNVNYFGDKISLSSDGNTCLI